MATNNTGNTGAILRPDEVNTLLLEPVEALSVAAQVSTVLQTASHALRIPSVGADPQAAWTAEGEEIPTSEAQIDEEVVTPRKLAGLTVISNELAADSNPAAAELIGSGLARDIARRVDQAFFGPSMGANAPTGLEGAAATDLHTELWSAQPDLDVFAEALYLSQENGASVTHWVMNPADFRTLSTLKESDGSARGLLTSDPTQPTARMIEGRPIVVSNHVTEGTVWAVDSSQMFLVIREDVTVEADTSAFFSSDSTAVRAIMRVGYGFTNPAGVVKIIGDVEPV